MPDKWILHFTLLLQFGERRPPRFKFYLLIVIVAISDIVTLQASPNPSRDLCLLRGVRRLGGENQQLRLASSLESGPLLAACDIGAKVGILLQ